ncbi:hypothetical protein BJ508DRAFT_377724 [Ascobolus immersus RN42]|uniref:Uncharacterized protein n=1 Tax=Ascobolus immersus RN42 TaxID=1160509 RepID=A0A3N4HZT2_ASCIM|nr:hypothetical protein BJ508DRAFT_377724 [Ascobolus immersus RN42]
MEGETAFGLRDDTKVNEYEKNVLRGMIMKECMRNGTPVESIWDKPDERPSPFPFQNEEELLHQEREDTAMPTNTRIGETPAPNTGPSLPQIFGEQEVDSELVLASRFSSIDLEGRDEPRRSVTPRSLLPTSSSRNGVHKPSPRPSQSLLRSIYDGKRLDYAVSETGSKPLIEKLVANGSIATDGIARQSDAISRTCAAQRSALPAVSFPAIHAQRQVKGSCDVFIVRVIETKDHLNARLETRTDIAKCRTKELANIAVKDHVLKNLPSFGLRQGPEPQKLFLKFNRYSQTAYYEFELYGARVAGNDLIGRQDLTSGVDIRKVCVERVRMAARTLDESFWDAVSPPQGHNDLYLHIPAENPDTDKNVPELTRPLSVATKGVKEAVTAQPAAPLPSHPSVSGELPLANISPLSLVSTIPPPVTSNTISSTPTSKSATMTRSFSNFSGDPGKEKQPNIIEISDDSSDEGRVEESDNSTARPAVSKTPRPEVIVIDDDDDHEGATSFTAPVIKAPTIAAQDVGDSSLHSSATVASAPKLPPFLMPGFSFTDFLFDDEDPADWAEVEAGTFNNFIPPKHRSSQYVAGTSAQPASVFSTTSGLTAPSLMAPPTSSRRRRSTKSTSVSPTKRRKQPKAKPAPKPKPTYKPLPPTVRSSKPVDYGTLNSYAVSSFLLKTPRYQHLTVATMKTNLRRWLEKKEREHEMTDEDLTNRMIQEQTLLIDYSVRRMSVGSVASVVSLPEGGASQGNVAVEGGDDAQLQAQHQEAPVGSLSSEELANAIEEIYDLPEDEFVQAAQALAKRQGFSV